RVAIECEREECDLWLWTSSDKQRFFIEKGFVVARLLDPADAFGFYDRFQPSLTRREHGLAAKELSFGEDLVIRAVERFGEARGYRVEIRVKLDKIADIDRYHADHPVAREERKKQLRVLELRRERKAALRSREGVPTKELALYSEPP